MARPGKPGTQYGGGNSGTQSKLHGLASSFWGQTQGGPSVSAPPTGTTTGSDLSGNTVSMAPGVANDGSAISTGNLQPPVVTNNPYTVKHPILDAIFGGGRGQAAANQANISYGLSTAEGANQLNNAMLLQKNQQDFEKAKLGIIHDNTLDEAQKANALQQLATDNANNSALITSSGAMDTPSNRASYDATVSEPSIMAAGGNANNRLLQSRVTGQQLSAVNDAQTGMEPTMVNTAQRNLATQNLQAQGQERLTPLTTSAQAAQLSYAPANARTEANKASLIPATAPFYNVNTKATTYATPMLRNMNANPMMTGGLTPPVSGSAAFSGGTPQPTAQPTNGQPPPIQVAPNKFLRADGVYVDAQGNEVTN